MILFIAIGALPGTADAQPASGVINTVAGNGISGWGGDGGPATLAETSDAYAVAVDAAGNLYIAQYGSNRVRKVSAATGIITTVAGNGTSGLSGDGGPATLAAVNRPIALTVSPAGDLYITEYDLGRIRKVDGLSGIITTVAGTGSGGGYNGDGIPATGANLNLPWGIVVDAAGDLYIAEHASPRIRKVSAATGLISTYAGTGGYGGAGDGGPATAATLYVPLGLALNSAGDLYIGDYGSNVIRKVDASTGIITTFAGTGSPGSGGDGGPATQASFRYVYDVAVNAAGDVFVADFGNARVRRIDVSTGIISTFAGDGTVGFAGDGGPATSAVLSDPIAVDVDAAGNVFISDYNNARTRMVGTRALPVITWANPSAITYGTALSATQLNATADVPGTFAYDPASGTVLNAGAGQTLSATFTPDDTATYAPVTKSVTIDVIKATPAFTWAVPAAVPSGTVLGPSQLNASSSVAGTFVYDPPAGTVVTATVQLYAYFTPDDSANYLSTSGDVQLTVLSGPVNGPPYTLTVTPAAGGKVHGAGVMCGAGYTACSVTMPAAMTLGLSATPSAGYTFTNWTGDCTGTTTSQWVNLQGPRTCGAVFTQVVETYSLTIAPVPAGGTVTGGGLTCGTGGSTCAVTFGSSTTAALTATADTGYVFAGWGGACSGTATGTSVTVNGVKTCSATFTASGGGASGPPYTLTVTKPAGGTITGAGITCGAAGNACAVTMPAAMTLGLAAAASPGYTFTAWTGDCTGTAASQWVNLQGPRTCGATFTSSGGGGGTPPGSGIITTFAGSGTAGYGGDGGPATAADMYYPAAVAADGAGNIYITDHQANRVRMVAVGTGVITTVAGTGSGGFSGDGGAATAAEMSNPYGIAVDGAGNLYIADYGNNRIRMVAAGTGIISTVAGTGVSGTGGDGGPATSAELASPFALAVDGAGNLLIGELDSHRVRRLTAATGIITTIAGIGTAGFSGDGGPATAAELNGPYGIDVDGSGHVYISDLYNNRVRRIDAASGIITTIAGTGAAGFSGDGGPATAAALDYPLGLAMDGAGNLFVADYNNQRVRMVTAGTGTITTVAGTGTRGFSGDGGPATAAQLNYPYGLGMDGADNLYVADINNNRVRRVGAGSVAPVDGPPYTLTITPPTGGRIQGAGINCGAGGTACSVTMPAQMTLGLAATPSAGYIFGGWTGHCSGASPSLWVDLKGARTCSATFTPR